ncbi:hypothetical protein A0H81_11384 [Grifola frondosa]|uniref:Cytochrome P450 67 n=1 Tax=Grifola frondosa TaxID=5627 RepID=A0A1C7LXJ7_GRIFR|nr:hypothetical protein A0H81_11384 [Grifola frondosa]
MSAVLTYSSRTCQLSSKDIAVAIAGSALIAHLLFKRYETYSIAAHFFLLITPPAVGVILLKNQSALLNAIVISFTSYLSALTLSVVLYRLSPFHPLAKYPGPVINKISKLWMAWLARTGKQHLYTQQLHDYYGDVVRTGPNELFIRDVSAITPIMGVNGLPKGPHWIGRALNTSVQNLVSLRDLNEHAVRRKIWNRAFSSAALKGYEEIIAKRAAQFVEGLEVQDSEVDLSKWFGWFTYDFMSDMAFGGGSEMMRDGDGDSIWHLLETGMIPSFSFGHVPWLGVYVGKIPMVAGTLKQFIIFGRKRTEERIKNGSLSRDLFHYLNNEDGAEKTQPSMMQLLSDGILAIVAGSDTTSGVLSALFLCLLSNPEAYKRLQAEIDKYYPPEENALDTKHHVDMAFLNAVINETMRLYPAVPSGSQRRVPKGSGGRTAGTYFIPEGTNVSIHFYSVHRDPRNFYPFPDSFWPDRWLIAAGQEEFKASGETFVHNAAAFIPFSFGPANCVGKGLALQEMRMLVCLIMQRLEMRFPEGWEPRTYEDGLTDHFVMMGPALPVVVKRRSQVI